MLQTGVRERAERTEQTIAALQKQVDNIQKDITRLTAVVEVLVRASRTTGTTAPPPESGSD